jgi:hypothetical protein
MSPAATYGILATAMTVLRIMTSDESASFPRVGRVIFGGVVMTGVLLGIEQSRPDIARPLAGLIFTTSLLVNGVESFEALQRAVTGADDGPDSVPTPPQSETVATGD